MKSRILIAIFAGCILFLTTGCKSKPAVSSSSSPDMFTAAEVKQICGSYAQATATCSQMLDAERSRRKQAAEDQTEAERVGKLAAADPNTPDSQFTEIRNPADIPEIYYALSGEAPDYVKLTEISNPDYSRLRNEFDKQDMVTRTRSKLDQEIQAFKDPRKRYLRYVMSDYFSVPLNHYDFKTQAFRLQVSLDRGTYFFTDQASGYGLMPTNGEKYQFYNVADQQRARQIEGLLSGTAKSDVELYLFAQDTKRDSDGGRQVECQIVRVVLHSNGREVARY